MRRQLDDAGFVLLHHFDDGARPEPHFVQPLHVVGRADELVDAGRLASDEQMQGNDVIHGSGSCEAEEGRWETARGCLLRLGFSETFILGEAGGRG